MNEKLLIFVLSFIEIMILGWFIFIYENVFNIRSITILIILAGVIGLVITHIKSIDEEQINLIGAEIK